MAQGMILLPTKRASRFMRGALALTALLLTTTLLLAVPAGAQSDHSTTLVLDEIGAFNSTNDVHTNEDGNHIPVLYVGETFHLKGQLNDGLGQGLGLKCLNLYVEPSANANPFATCADRRRRTI